MGNYYVANTQRFMERLADELPFWLSALKELHPDKMAIDLGGKIQDRFAKLLPTLPFISGDENKMTFSLLDAAR